MAQSRVEGAPAKDPKYQGYGRDQYLADLNNKKELKRPKNFRKQVSANKIVIGEPMRDTFVVCGIILIHSIWTTAPRSC